MATAVAAVAVTALVYVTPASAGSEVVHGAAPAHQSKPARPGPRTNNLSYHGGSGGIGVQTSPHVYLVTWGWTSDPSGEKAYLVDFFNHVGGSGWNNSVTQYCQGVPTGTIFCAGVSGAVYAGNPTGVLTGTWDDTSVAPSRPTQTDLANEAISAAAHFGNTAAGSNHNTQYVIMTATGKSASGFGVQYCAWHSSTSSSFGRIAYTNLPYITDAGASCGAGFVNGSSGQLDGVSIVEGHEFAETETDPYPSSGWLDSGGAENGDKCAWISNGQGAAADVSLNGKSFPVQSLWSNAFNSGNGGCVLSY